MKHSALVPTLLAAALFAAACGHADIDNKEAVRSAMLSYLEEHKASTGIDPNAMDVKVEAVEFDRDTARATVAFLVKGSDQGMRGNYTLTRAGDKWGSVKRQDLTAGPHGLDPSQTPAGEPGGLPATSGHDPGGKNSGKEPLIPIPLGGAAPPPNLPAGHPPISGTK